MRTTPASHDYEDERVPLREYWAILRKRLWTVALIFALCVGLGAAWVYNQQNVYRASVSVEIRTETPQILGDIEPVVDPVAGARYWSTAEYYETQYRIIRSRSVAAVVVEVLQLDANLEFLGIDGNLEPAAIERALERVDPIARLIEMTAVEAIASSTLVRISVENDNPQLAMTLANTLADVYVERNALRQLQGTDEAFRWLENERVALQDRVEDAEAELLTFRQEHEMNSATLGDRLHQLSEHLATVNVLLTEAETDVSELRMARRRMRQALESDSIDEVPVADVLENPLIQALKRERQTLRTEFLRLSERYGERHEDVRGVAASLDEIESSIVAEASAILESYELRLDRAEARQAELQEGRDEILSEMTALSLAEPNYNQLNREIVMSEDILTMIERRYKETDLYRRQRDVNNIEVLDAAILPVTPVRPRRMLLMAAAMMLGTILGVGCAFLFELLDNTVRSQEDVEQILGLTFLGVLPSIRNPGRTSGPQRDMFVHQHPKSAVAECCRSIRTNLHFMAPDEPMSRLLITSAGPREGKTLTTVNLATVMAQSNHRVLVVDTDMRRPRLHRAFGLNNAVGLTNLILGEVSREAAVQKTPIEGLEVLSCGPIPPNPTELMHTQRFKDIVDELSQHYDRVIFDSPPVVAVADAMIMSAHVDGVLFVIKSGHTSKEVLKRAVGQLSGVSAPFAGAVLNDLNLEDRAYRYHYYYGYYHRYGQYYEETPTRAPQRADA